ncbi:MauE/DoxX family redox-associated membrane protein [Roseivirga seohaensis]|uniref:MauE/DoxX family redox-associated membrane protein n=1 Tax=Roseivirga seohaensis TaxID=1914963 RepID=UPI003BAD6264
MKIIPLSIMPSKISMNFSSVINYSTVFIFAFSAIDKSLNFDTFYVQFAKIPMVYELELWFLAYILIVIEFVIVALLLVDKTRIIGQYIAVASLIVFTVHILTKYVVNNDSCSCGGVFTFIPIELHVIVNLILIFGLGYLILIKERHESLEKTNTE